MIHIAPNISKVSAIVIGRNVYEMQPEYDVLILEVLESWPVEGMRYMAGAEAGRHIEALLRRDEVESNKLVPGMLFHGQIRKISRKLWRIVRSINSSSTEDS